MNGFFRYRDFLYLISIILIFYFISIGMSVISLLIAVPILLKLFMFVVEYENIMSDIRNHDDEKGVD